MGPSIIVTGCNGFVGRHLMNSMRLKGVTFETLHHCNFTATHSLPVEQCEIVIHLAGRAHVIRETSEEPYEEFYKANCEYSLDVARAAAANGLRRFIYISSIGVYGKSSYEGIVSEKSPLDPVEDYARSKLEGEQRLTTLSKELGFELVIVRPALVYGYDAPGNIERLLKLASKLRIIPIAEKYNKRSFVYVENLVDFLLLVTTHPNAAGKTFNMADAPISTHDLINNFAKGMELKRSLFSFPRFIWKFVLRLVGMQKMYEQLFEDLVLDMSLAENELGWQPKHDTVSSLQETGKRFIEANTAKKPRE